MTQYEEVSGGSGAEAWNKKDLKEGAELEGRYVDKRTNVGPNASNMYIIEDDAGKEWGVWGGTVIDGRFQNIAVGKMVKIKYLGIQTGKTGKQFKAYQVWQGIVAPGDEEIEKEETFKTIKSSPKRKVPAWNPPALKDDEESIDLDL